MAESAVAARLTLPLSAFVDLIHAQMFFLYLIVAFLVFLFIATTQKNRGFKHALLQLGGYCSFFLSAISFVIPFFVTLEPPYYTAGWYDADKFLFVLTGMLGMAGCIVFMALGRLLLIQAQTLIAGDDRPDSR